MITILHTESSLGFGGQEIRILGETEEFVKRGYRVVILCQPKSGISVQGKKRGFIIEELTMPNALHPRTILCICRIIRKYNVAIINTHSSKDSWLSAIASRIMRRPIIRTRHVSIPVKRNFFSEFVYKKLCDIIITTGEALKEMLITDNNIPADKIISVPTGVDTTRFCKQEPDLNARREFGIKEQDFVIGMLGFIRSEKGHSYFLEAVPYIVKAIPQAKFLIVGGEPMGSLITDRVRNTELSNWVTITGFREDVIRIASLIEVIVQPSLGKEGVPQSLMQSLSMEKACIATKVGAIDELIIDDKTGLFIPVKDPRAIADKVIFLFKHPETRERLGKAGRRLVEEKFAINKMSDRIEGVYRQVLSLKSKN